MKEARTANEQFGVMAGKRLRLEVLYKFGISASFEK